MRYASAATPDVVGIALGYICGGWWNFVGGVQTGKGVGNFVTLGRCRCLVIYLFRLVNTFVSHSCLP